MTHITIYGYGAQGRAQALNVRDSGWDVTVVLRENSSSLARAAHDEIRTSTDCVAATRATQIAVLLIPDTAQPALYNELLAPHLPPHATLIFAHGFNIHYERILPREDLDVLLAAPMCDGIGLREKFCANEIIPIITAIHHDANGAAADTLQSYIGALTKNRCDVIPSTFAAETETDLFSEQVLLCGGLAFLILAVFDTLVAAGYDPKIAYYTALHEPKNLARLFSERGLQDGFANISAVARHGALTRGPRVIDDHVRATLQTILSEIQSGDYARELITNPPPAAAPWREHLIERLQAKR